jgi:hypothetical protein
MMTIDTSYSLSARGQDAGHEVKSHILSAVLKYFFKEDLTSEQINQKFLIPIAIHLKRWAP